MRKFAAAYRPLAALGGMTVAWLLLPAIALADNCSSEADCLQTGGYNAGIAIGGGLIGLGAVLLGNWIGGPGTGAGRGRRQEDKPSAPSRRLRRPEFHHSGSLTT